MNGFFEGTIIWEEGDSAYHKSVFEQIRNTIISIEGEGCYTTTSYMDTYQDKIEASRT